MEHAWCHDITRDAAVRAAEDGRDRPLPTLGEAIAAVTKTMPDNGKGEVMEQGLRTERVVLEVTGAPGWRVHVTGIDVESVRVVEETHFDDLAQVAMERDAAIRERDNERLVRIRTETDCDFARREKESAIFHITELRTERDKLQASVAELEEQLESVACRAATAETALEAASGGGEGESYIVTASGIPLYRQLPQPRGWLTEEEREAVDAARDYFDDDDHGDSECVFIARVLKQLLARSSPPEVVLPDWVKMCVSHGRQNQLLAALAAAGVAVKEVP